MQRNISQIFKNKSNVDSVKKILDRMEYYCSTSEPVFRLRILTDIEQNIQLEGKFTNITFTYVINYLNRNKFIGKHDSIRKHEFELNEAYYGFIPIGSGFDDYTMTKAEELSTRTDLDIYDSLMIALYSGDAELFVTMLKGDGSKNTTIQDVYKETIQSFKRMPEGNISLGAGLWIPIGNLSLLGPHPLAKLELGIHGKRLSSDISIHCRFTESKSEYIVDSLSLLIDTLSSNRHFSLYLGFEPGFNIINNSRFEFSIVTGLGLDVLKAFYPQDYPEGTKKKDAKPISFSAINFNVGLVYRIKNARGGYWAFAARYEFLNYENKRGTDLSGDAISFSISRGLFENAYKKQNLEFWGE